MYRRHFLRSLVATSAVLQTGCVTAALMSRALSDGHRMGKSNSPATSGRRVHEMGHYRLFSDAAQTLLVIVGEQQHWLLHSTAPNTLKQLLPRSISAPTYWLFTHASVAVPAQTEQQDVAPHASLRFFSVYRPHLLSATQQQTLHSLGYEQDHNAAQDLRFMNQLLKHGVLQAGEPTLNRVLSYQGQAYQAGSMPADFFEHEPTSPAFPDIIETIALNPATQTPTQAFSLPPSPLRIAATGQVSLNGKALHSLDKQVQLYPYWD